MLNALAAITTGESQVVTVFVARGEGASRSASVTLNASSESDPAKRAAASIKVSR